MAYDAREDEMYRCAACGLEFDADEVTSKDDDENDLCPACGKALDDGDIA